MRANQEWWRGGAIYQIYLPSFRDGNDDGFGDLPGLLSRLDYIAALGVDAIWVSPFHPSPMHDYGYDVADYRSVDPRFGTLRDFDAVIARAHDLGLKVIIDLVWSHSSSEHPWFAESEECPRGPKADWYIWADPAADGGPPNNWLSVFGGSAWNWSPRRRQYYLHHFLPTQPKLNLRSDGVLAAHFSNAEFWIARGVDGFRFDAVDFMLNDESLASNPPLMPRPAEMPWNPFRLQRHVHDMSGASIVDLATRIRAFTDRFPGLVTMGEISSEVGAFDRIAAVTAGTRLHMAYTLRVMKSAFTPSEMRQWIASAADLNRSGWICWSFSNHDVERVASRWNPDLRDQASFAKLANALLLSLPGSVCLYQGEELGLPGSRLPRDAIRDPFGRRFYPSYAGRDSARTPMPWVAGAPNAGFSRASTTWLPVSPAHDALAADRVAAAPDSTLQACREMLAWRKRHPALIEGDLRFIDVPAPVVGWRRRLDDDNVLAVFNLAPEPVTLPADFLPPFESAAELSFVTPPCEGGLRLPPFGCSVGVEHGNRQRR
ncbi:MAG TPA: alpha-amylase family glycosyl hydrolase [Stellaceae bacterium]|nr:alpha-amylase family glycosyl hydrolase [Stellaceae bacterium]